MARDAFQHEQWRCSVSAGCVNKQPLVRKPYQVSAASPACFHITLFGREVNKYKQRINNRHTYLWAVWFHRFIWIWNNVVSPHWRRFDVLAGYVWIKEAFKQLISITTSCTEVKNLQLMLQSASCHCWPVLLYLLIVYLVFFGFFAPSLSCQILFHTTKSHRGAE